MTFQCNTFLMWLIVNNGNPWKVSYPFTWLSKLWVSTESGEHLEAIAAAKTAAIKNCLSVTCTVNWSNRSLDGAGLCSWSKNHRGFIVPMMLSNLTHFEVVFEIFWSLAFSAMDTIQPALFHLLMSYPTNMRSKLMCYKAKLNLNTTNSWSDLILLSSDRNFSPDIVNLNFTLIFVNLTTRPELRQSPFL